MDGIFLALFLVTAFVGGFASGLVGFAMGFVVSGIWLHILTPIQTTALIIGYGLLTQNYGVWKLRHALNWQNIARFIAVPLARLAARTPHLCALRSLGRGWSVTHGYIAGEDDDTNVSCDMGGSVQEEPFRPDKPRTVDRCRMRPQNRLRCPQPRRLQQHQLVRPYCFQRMRRG
jgi:hypothetical protein